MPFVMNKSLYPSRSMSKNKGPQLQPYASPNPKLNLSSVQERLYRGFCVNNELLPATLEEFRARRDDIENLIRGQAELARRKRKEMLSFINDFYRTTARTKSVERYFVKRCRS